MAKLREVAFAVGASIAFFQPIAMGAEGPDGGLDVHVISVPLQLFTEIYAQQESKDVIVDPRLRGEVLIQSGMTPDKITKEEFYSALLSNNHSAYEEDGVINVIMVSMAKNRKIPFYDGKNRGDLVASQVVDSLLELKNRSPEELIATLRPLVEPWGYIAADNQSKTIALVTTVGNIERLAEMVRMLDK